MLKRLIFDPAVNEYLVVGILFVFGLAEIISGKLSRSRRRFSDWIQEAGGFLVISLLIKPSIVLVVVHAGQYFFPAQYLVFSELNFWIALILYLLIDDVLQYMYHRSAHEYDFLWKLHRPHHQAEELGFFVSYRNAGLYYILMPNIWWIGLCTFLGAGAAVAFGLVLKQLVIIGSHSSIPWDKPLYRIPVLRQVMTVVERIFVTPAFHYAHHGKSMLDGISDPNGNYGNMFSLWDQLFGTARFTRQFPTEFGLVNDPKEHWTATYFYPFIHSKDPKSELSKGFRKDPTITPGPVTVDLVKGRHYLWCRCGRSQTPPICDGSHHGTKYKPQLFEAKADGPAKLCNCKLTKHGPYCDNAHRALLKQSDQTN